jgi:hypothetical protein
MTSPVFGTEHLRGCPGWDCRACAAPWPCADARAGLLAEFRAFPSGLAVYMAAQMQEALYELASNGGPLPPDFYERFLAWVRHPHLESAPPATAKPSGRQAAGTGKSPTRRRGSKRRQPPQQPAKQH